MYCIDCKYWHPHKVTEGGIERSRADSKSGNCECPKIVDGGTLPEPIDGVRYGGYEGYGDYFHSGPKFGCVHFAKL